jgi:CHAT domain-containing protein
MIRQFSQACARPDSALAEVQKQGQDLFSLLVQPVLADLPPLSVTVIELDHSLASLPIEALRSPAGWYFGEKYPVVYSPGITAEKRLRTPRHLGSADSVLLIDTSGG